MGFLFDNDGVLIDSSDLHWQAWEMLAKEDPHFVMTREQFVGSFGKRNDLILQELFPGLAQEERNKWAERKEELFRECARGRITLLPGMERFLALLEEKSIPRIIASSTPVKNLLLFLESTVLGKYFHHFVSAEEVAEGKPAPDVFIEAAKRLGLPPNACIVVEDAPAGVEAGKRAGCFVVALETTHNEDLLGPFDLIYSSPEELNLTEILKQHNAWRKEQPETPIRKWIRYAGGSVLVLLGLVSIVIPFSPGLLLILSGLYLINRRWMNRKIHHLKRLWKRARKPKS